MDLNQVTLPATDVTACADFYRRMGFIQIVDSAPRYVRFECPEGEATFSLHHVDSQVADTGTVVYFECTDLDARVEALREAGFDFEQLPTDEAWLWREARLRDPAGNVICLFHAGEHRRNPPWRIPRPEA